MPQGYGGDSELPKTGTALGRIMGREVPKGAKGANLPQGCSRRLGEKGPLEQTLYVLPVNKTEQ